MLSMCPSSIVSLNRNNGVDVVGQSEPFKRLVMTSLKPTNRNCRSVSHIRDACIITLFFLFLYVERAKQVIGKLMNLF